MINSRRYIPIFYFILLSLLCNGQIITVPTNKAVLCCSPLPILPGYGDSIDIDGDNSYEIQFSARYFIDAIGFGALGNNETQLNQVLGFGLSYPRNKWKTYGEGMPSTPIGNSWGDWWLPNTGIKYLGFRKINSLADTTFGWVKLDFRGEIDGPLDTLFIIEYGYSMLPNVQLNAGQSVITSIDESEINSEFRYYPNPVLSVLDVDNPFLNVLDIKLIDTNGRLILTTQIDKGTCAELDLTFLQTGLYYLNVISFKDQKTYKVLKK